MPEKICRAIATETNGVTAFAPEDGREIPTPIIIHPDEDGVQWYWTPDDAPVPDTPRQPQR